MKQKKQKLELVYKEKQDIESKIEKLKEQLHQIHDRYLLDIFYILYQIFQLRIEQIPSYTIADLSREKGVDYDINKLRYVFGFKDMSNKSKKLIAEKKINPSTILTIINSSTEFRKPENQDALVQEYLNDKITMTQISSLPAFHILQMLKDNPMSEETKINLQGSYQIKGVAQRLDKNIKHFQTPETKKMVRESFEILKSVVDRIAPETDEEREEPKEAQYFCPYCRHIVVLADGKLNKKEMIGNKGRNTKNAIKGKSGFQKSK